MDTLLSKPFLVAARLHIWAPARLVFRAEALLQSENPDRARPLLEEAVRRAPGWDVPHMLLARIASSRGEREKSLLFAAELNPQNREVEKALLEIRAWHHEPEIRAWRLYHAGKKTDALLAFEEALELIPDRVPESVRSGCLAGIGWCLHDLSRYEEAEKAFRTSLEVEPDLVHALKGLGVTLYRQDRLEEAESVLASALARAPEMRDAQSMIGWCEYGRGLFGEALTRFDEICTSNPLLSDARWGRAWCLLRLDRNEEAMQAFIQASELDIGHPSVQNLIGLVLSDPTFVPLRHTLGFALLASEQHADAIGLLTAETLDDMCGRVLALLGLDDAEEAMEVLASISPEHRDSLVGESETHGEILGLPVTVRQLRARCLMKLKMVDEAGKELEDCVRHDPSHASARLDLADQLLACGDKDGAMTQLGEARRAARSHRSRALRKMEEVNLRRNAPVFDALESLLCGRPEEVVPILDAATGIHEREQWKAEMLRGRASMTLGQPEEALPRYRRAVELQGGRAQPVLELSNCLTAVGKTGEALDVLLAACRELPDDLELLGTAQDMANAAGRHNLARKLGRQKTCEDVR